MKNWLQKNVKNIIITAFVIPILLVAFVSISHVTSFYGLSNPVTWAVYLSVGIEIAALSALAAVSVNMGRFVYLPFFVVTLIQMIGNIFFSFSYIDETGQQFQDWVNMVGGLFENIGIEKTDLNTHKTIVAFLSGGLLPIISLTFAHMLVKFSEQSTEDNKEILNEEEFKQIIDERRRNSENEKWKPTESQLEEFERILQGKYNRTEKTEIKPESKESIEDATESLEMDFQKQEISDETNVEKFHDNDEIGEVIPEIQEEVIQPIDDTTAESVEKKNDSSDDTIKNEEWGNEDYKILNYSNRNAQN